MKYLGYIILCLSLYNSSFATISDSNEEEESDDNSDDYESKNITTCTTPNREAGYCVSLISCPQMVKAIATYKYVHIDYFMRSKCGNFKVCCGARTMFDPTRFVFGDEKTIINDFPFEISNKLNKTAKVYREYVKKRILPSKTYCGYQHTDDRFYTDNETAIDEFPWLVNFVATYAINKGPPKTDDFYNYCAGVLINQQYVLSSSYCSYKLFHIKAVRLGQHNLRNNSTCVEDSVDVECSSFVEIPIVENFLIVGDSNFVLYKLQRPVSYDDYIRPICLSLDDSKRPKVNESLTTSGWSDSGKDKVNRKRIISRILNNEECNPGLNNSVDFGKVNPKYAICAVKEPNSNAEVEQSDKGSPFMYSYKHQWYLDGIVNYISGDHLIGERLTDDVRNWILDALFHSYRQSHVIPDADIKVKF